jgi:malate synthase
MPGPNQLDVKRDDVKIGRDDLLRVPEGTRTEAGLRHNVRVGIQYIESWLRGSGCVPLYHLMEDAATAEISRAQVWQWLHHKVSVDGKPVTADAFGRIVDEEMQRIRREVGDAKFQGGRFGEARDLFVRLSTAPTFEEFLTLPAYDLLDTK